MIPGDAAATAIGLATFLLLAVRSVRGVPTTRAVTACLGAIALVLVGAVTPADALTRVDTGTILLLFGMLAHVEGLARSGFYDWAAARLVDRVDTTRRLAVETLLVAAALSAVALNDAVVLLLTPVLVRAVRDADVDPVPPVLAVVLGANIGSTATPLGNPQNAYILSQSPLSFLEFVAVLAPVALLALGVAAGLLARWTPDEPVTVDVDDPGLDRGWAASSGGFIAVTFVLLALPLPWAAGTIAAALGVLHVAWLQLFRGIPGEDVLRGVDWSILVLFVGMFAVIAGLEGTPLVEALAGVGGGPGLAAATFVLSNLVSNVPAVILLATSVADPAGWYLLAAVSTLAGNATPIASAATLIALDQASREGVDISPLRLVRLGLPIAVVTCLLATGVLVVVL